VVVGLDDVVNADVAGVVVDVDDVEVGVVVVEPTVVQGGRLTVRL
jgi:hypothetical protein